LHLCNQFDIDRSEHNYCTGSNPMLDEKLAKESAFGKRQFFSNQISANGLSFSTLTNCMCYMGFGSKIVYEKRPDLEIIDNIMQKLRQLSININGELLNERQTDPNDDVLFRLIRPFFLHRFTHALIAMVGSRFCRDYWRWRWNILDDTLAALYRYIPLGRKNLSRCHWFIYIVNATGQVALQGQELFTVIVGKVQQHLTQLKKRRRLTTNYAKGIGPKSIWEKKSIGFDKISCFDKLFHLSSEDHVEHPERLFKDFVLLVGVHGIFRSFNNTFKNLVKDIPNVEFFADLPLSALEAKAKRNQIYEQELFGSGNPWSNMSWNSKNKKKKMRCQPEVGFKACMNITNYLSGIITCMEYSSLEKVWKLLSNNKLFKVFKLINRLDTPSREIIYIGKFILQPPIHYQFTGIVGEKNINAFIFTVRVRYDLPIIKEYDHFELVRKNYILSSFYSPEQFFSPGLCKDKRNPTILFSKLKESAERRSRKNLSRWNVESEKTPNSWSPPPSMSLISGRKRVCENSHPLHPMPLFRFGLKCRICRKFLEFNAIKWQCLPCDWISCDDCFYDDSRDVNSVKGKRRGSAYDFTNIVECDNYNGSSSVPLLSSNDKVKYRMSVKLLQDMLMKKDAEVHELNDKVQQMERSVRMAKYSRSTPILEHQAEKRNRVFERFLNYLPYAQSSTKTFTESALPMLENTKIESSAKHLSKIRLGWLNSVMSSNGVEELAYRQSLSRSKTLSEGSRTNSTSMASIIIKFPNSGDDGQLYIDYGEAKNDGEESDIKELDLVSKAVEL